jgi:hypothetical protein
MCQKVDSLVRRVMRISAQCFGSGSGILDRMPIRIPGFDDQKLKLIFFAQKLQFTYS